jgi:hypothetical protein
MRLGVCARLARNHFMFSKIVIGLLEIRGLVVLSQMLEVSIDYRFPLLGNDGNYLAFVVGNGLAFLNGNGPLGAMAQAGAQPIAKEVTDQPCLAFYHLQGPFRTPRHAKPASVALFFINLDNLALHRNPPNS